MSLIIINAIIISSLSKAQPHGWEGCGENSHADEPAPRACTKNIVAASRDGSRAAPSSHACRRGAEVPQKERCPSCLSLWVPLGDTSPIRNKTLMCSYKDPKGTNTKVTSAKGHFCASHTHARAGTTGGLVGACRAAAPYKPAGIGLRNNKDLLNATMWLSSLYSWTQRFVYYKEPINATRLRIGPWS